MNNAQIKAANPQGQMTMVSGSYGIEFDNGVTFTTANSNEQRKLWNKLKRMGYGQHYNFGTDTAKGIVQAANNCENPFAFSIIEA